MPDSNDIERASGVRSICWLRRDLRLSDHAALAQATRRSTEVAVAFVFDTTILGRLEDRDDPRVAFIVRSLAEVDAGLRTHGSRLVLLHGDPTVEIPKLAYRLGADTVYAGRDTEPAALARDERVALALRQAGRTLHTPKDQVVFQDPEVATDAGEPFRVFTPYSRAWLRSLSSDHVEPQDPDFSKLLPEAVLRTLFGRWDPEGWDPLVPPDAERIGFRETDPWLAPGERAALDRLARFEERIDDYAECRHRPAAEGTSGLSAHLRHGTLSVREAVRAARRHPGPGGDKWLLELVWREFYQMILARFPHVVDRSFQPRYDAIVWPGEPEHFEAWKAGATGYPIVDAAMRCLNATGWMHNRLRMVAASFLTKDLLIDWRLGERYFARRLLDYDLASNNGGWQWAASTGVDPQPYFRVFNPVLQSRKFDPEGEFIRRWVPELAGLDARSVHWPHEATLLGSATAGVRLGQDYPGPVVDHALQRRRAIELLGSVRLGAAGRLP